MFFAEFKRFSLDLTALFSDRWVNTSALVSSRCAAVWTERIWSVWHGSNVLFHFSRINITLNVYRTCFIKENYITIIIVIVLSPSPTSKYICSREPAVNSDAPLVGNHCSRSRSWQKLVNVCMDKNVILKSQWNSAHNQCVLRFKRFSTPVSVTRRGKHVLLLKQRCTKIIHTQTQTQIY